MSNVLVAPREILIDGKTPGMYWINLRDTAEHPRWLLPTLTYHEAIPGHHLQLSIQREAKMPLIRRVSYFSSYLEGWALYAEQLADEMGVYRDDDLGRIGFLHDAMIDELADYLFLSWRAYRPWYGLSWHLRPAAR